jgi:hypothetical protein
VDEPTLQGELAALARAEILYPKGRPPRCAYVFRRCPRDRPRIQPRTRG